MSRSEPSPGRSPTGLWTAVGEVVAILGVCVAIVAWLFPVKDSTSDPTHSPTQPTTAGSSESQPSTATTVAALPPEQWSLAFSDSLAREGQWRADEDPAWGGSCWFDDETYWVRQATARKTFTCDGLAREYGDFALEFEAVISGRGCIDLVFRDGGVGTLYTYLVCTTGHASAFQRYAPRPEPIATLFDQDDIAVAENTPLRVGLLATGERLRFFLNGKKIADAANAASLSGRFYLRATADPEPVTVGFRNFKVWTP